MSEAQPSGAPASEAEQGRAMLRVVRGAPDEAELAALVAVVASLPSAAPDPPAAPSRWADRAGGMRRTLRPAPDAWRWSARDSGWSGR